jgi:hypothetical protein
MTFTYVDGEDFYAVDLDEEESTEYDEGEDGRQEIYTQVMHEVEALGIPNRVTVYHADGHSLYDMQKI